SGVALDGRWNSWNKRDRKQCNLRSNPSDCSECMTSRHTRRNAQGELVTLSNQELARLEKTNRQQQGQTDTTMGDHANQEQLTAQLQQMQQQMFQMQQTIQAQQDAAEQAALARQEQQARTLKVVPEKEHGDKGDSGLFSDEDPSTDPTKRSSDDRTPRIFMERLLHSGVENQNGREIRTTSGTQNDHVLPPSSSHHHISLQKKKKNEINVMEKGKKEKKHGATGKVEQEVGTKSGVALDGRWTSWNKRGRKQCNLPPLALIYLLFLFFFIFFASLQRGIIPKNSIVGFAYCKGRRISTLLRRILNPISFILLIQ
ncbi:hypothetical protein IGI04_039973, partial [Brassica rapa subsp. trilocularis]